MKVIKNFLDEEEFIKLQGIFMSAHCSYYFQTCVADYGDKDYMFTHTLFDNYNPNSELYKYTETCVCFETNESYVLPTNRKTNKT